MNMNRKDNRAPSENENLYLLARRRKVKQRHLTMCHQAASRSLLGNGYNPNLPPLPAISNRSHSSKVGITTSHHPYGVLPYGNIMLAASGDSVRRKGLGPELSNLNDEQIVSVLSFLDGVSLSRITACSRFLYVAAHQTELWRDLTLQLHNEPSTTTGYNDNVIQFFEDTWKDMWFHSYYNRRKGKNNMSVVSNLPRHRPIHVHGVYSDTFYRSFLCRSFALDPTWLEQSNVSREDAASLLTETFLTKYERANIPVIIQGATTSWPAIQKWTNPNYLIEKTKECISFRATSGSAPYPAQFSMKAYLDYCASSAAKMDEAPLYLFDRSFAIQAPDLFQDYYPSLQKTCPYFSPDAPHGHDLFGLLGDGRRPDHKWIILGPQRSGSNFHIDPNATHAWNVPIVGRKFWIFYPPGIPPPGVIPSPDGDEVTMPISVGEWFLSFWSEHVKQRNNPDVSKRPLECIVSPGELIFVPHGWWHLVYNLDEGVSIALTQNYVSSTNLPTVLRFLNMKRNQISGCRDRSAEAVQPDQFYEEFARVLKDQRPDLQSAHHISEKGWTCSAWKDDDNSDNEQNKTQSYDLPSIESNTHLNEKDSSFMLVNGARKHEKRKYDDSNVGLYNPISVMGRAKSLLVKQTVDSPMGDQEMSGGTFSFSFLQ